MRPSDFLTSSYEYSGTFTLAPSRPYGRGSNDTITTPLGPFSIDTGGHQWTSAEAQYLSTFGYSYPEIQDWIKGQTAAQLAQKVTAEVNKMWGGQSTPSKRSGDIDRRQQVLEWSVSVAMRKFELDGRSFIVRLFVGDVPADPTTWYLSPSCAGSFVVLPPQAVPEGPLADVMAYDDISLVQALRNVGQDGQDVQTVVQYLTQKFQWRVQLVRLLVSWFIVLTDRLLRRWMIRSSLQTSTPVLRLRYRQRASRLRVVSTSFRHMGKRRRILRSRWGSRVGIPPLQREDVQCETSSFVCSLDCLVAYLLTQVYFSTVSNISIGDSFGLLVLEIENGTMQVHMEQVIFSFLGPNLRRWR